MICPPRPPCVVGHGYLDEKALQSRCQARCVNARRIYKVSLAAPLATASTDAVSTRAYVLLPQEMFGIPKEERTHEPRHHVREVEADARPGQAVVGPSHRRRSGSDRRRDGPADRRAAGAL